MDQLLFCGFLAARISLPNQDPLIREAYLL